MSELNRRDIPPEAGPDVPVFKISPAIPLQVICLSRSLWGVYVHWDGRRTRECLRDSSECQGCKSGQPQRWKGYLCVLHYTTGKLGFVELTPALANHLLRKIPEGTLRGWFFRFERSGKSANGRALLTETRPPSPLHENIPEERDPEGILRKLWGWGRSK